MELPTELISQFEGVYKDADNIFGGMTKAGAEVVEHNIRANVPEAIAKSNMMRCLKTTKTYKTPSDRGINTKVGFFGYFENHDGKKTPAPLVGNVFEYGRSSSPYPKQPFMRKSFAKGDIEKAMLEAQKKLSGGLLQ